MINSYLKLFLNITCAIVMLFFSACKKDALIVNETKIFIEDTSGYKGIPFEGPSSFIFYPNNQAEYYKATGMGGTNKGSYKINGSKITVKVNGQTIELEVLSPTEIKEVKYGGLFKLKT